MSHAHLWCKGVEQWSTNFGSVLAKIYESWLGWSDDGFRGFLLWQELRLDSSNWNEWHGHVSTPLLIRCALPSIGCWYSTVHRWRQLPDRLVKVHWCASWMPKDEQSCWNHSDNDFAAIDNGSSPFWMVRETAFGMKRFDEVDVVGSSHWILARIKDTVDAILNERNSAQFGVAEWMVGAVDCWHACSKISLSIVGDDDERQRYLAAFVRCCLSYPQRTQFCWNQRRKLEDGGYRATVRLIRAEEEIRRGDGYWKWVVSPLAD